ncbi:ABC transporter substrate-binding protein [Mycetocola spongiae]|uniref:ABC transporter substrate-binding protein n=1 Tax=Mycetocola spongiae TaxID=2859226 RepID=UPI001CF2ED20|nr:ABC transporter substrate-binding protein [Mycetocola spongiae]UCR88896.1 ABC transporter substrate-binding protein [Mycetocola spongiae]
MLSSRSLTAALAAGLAMVLGLSACSAGPDSAAAGDIKTRTVTDAAGTVEVPEDPQRIVSVDFYSPAMLLDLGYTPVAVVEGFGVDDPDLRPTRYHEALRDAPTVGMFYDVNIEAVLAAKPDLILAENRFMQDGQLDRLKKIAPVVQIDGSGPDAWRERARFVAAAVGKDAEAAAQEAEFDARAQRVHEEYADILATKTFAVLNERDDYSNWSTYPAGHFYVPTWDSIGATMREATAAEPDPETPNMHVWLPMEQLGLVGNADIIIVSRGEGDEDFGRRMAGNAIWENLPAVTAGLVFQDVPAATISSFTWGLDDLASVETILAEVRAAINR